jgi:hypothetical protein
VAQKQEPNWMAMARSSSSAKLEEFNQNVVLSKKT